MTETTTDRATRATIRDAQAMLRKAGRRLLEMQGRVARAHQPAFFRAACAVDEFAALIGAAPKPEGEAETVSKLYAAWLSERGAELSGDRGEDGGGAWEIAVEAFTLPAAERWEIAYKLEMLEWLLSSGDPGAHVRLPAFAGILADLGR